MKIPYIPILFTLIILYVAVTTLDWNALFGAFQQADWTFVWYAMVVWVGLVALKAFKWQQIVSALHGKISLMESVQILFIALFISIITPGRLGDFVRAIYIKEKIPLGKGVLAVVVDRAMDVISLLIFAGVGLILLTRAGGIEIVSPELIIVLILGSIIGLWIILTKRAARKVFRVFQRFIPTGMRGPLLKHGNSFYDAIPLFRKNFLQIILAVTASTAAWILSITFGWFLMLALHLPMEWTVALAVVPILALIEIIPVGVLGIGTREIGAVIVMGAFGATPEAAIAFSLLFFALGYIPSFIMGSILFNRKPIPMDGGLAGLAKHLSK